jgi:hypothetical protein
MSMAMRAVRVLGVAALALAAAACGGGGSGPPPTSPTGAPTIANLVASFGQACTTPSGQQGTALTMTVSYTDPEGDVAGGSLSTNATFQPSGQVGVINFAVPADTASTTGTTSGSIQVLPCLRFGADSAVSMSVTLVDASGAGSNTLTAQPAKPQGAP